MGKRDWNVWTEDSPSEGGVYWLRDFSFTLGEPPNPSDAGIAITIFLHQDRLEEGGPLEWFVLTFGSSEKIQASSITGQYIGPIDDPSDDE